MKKLLLKRKTSLQIGLVFMAASTFLPVNSQTANLWFTSGSGTQRMQTATETFGSGAAGSATITVNEGTTYQTIDGFGFTLTEGSAKVISLMSASAQTTLLNDLYGANGIAMKIVRLGVGATDLSDYAFSYRDGASFSLAGPDLTYTIPILKKILAINSSIKVLATPWSAPMWMKSNGSFTGGELKAENYASYAQYWLDYMNAMRAQGIEIWAITPQNEPLNGTNTPSMNMSKENQLGLINSYLGPTLRAAGYNCKIICYDHNCDNTDYPIYVANNSTYVDGSAFHLYGGSISALTTVKNATNKNVYFTEQYTGAGGSFSGDLVWHTQNVMLGSLNNWAKIALEWNLAADPNNGPYIPGTCSSCLGGVTVNGSTATKNVGYYIVAHLSKVIDANAVRIGSSSSNGSLVATAAKNTDGSKALVVVNTSGSAINFNVSWNATAFDYSLAGSSVVSFKWSNSTSSSSSSSSSSSGGTISVPGTVQAESYTAMSGIQTETTTDAGGGSNVGYIEAGDWMEYSINAPSSGSYAITYRIASQNGGGSVTMSRSGTNLATTALPSTGGWQTWTNVSASANLVAGTQTIRLTAGAGGWNINYWNIAATSSSSSSSSSGGWTQTIQAESYSSMSGVQLETTTDAGGGQNVGWIDANDWMGYPTITVPVAGTYTIEYRVASQGGGGSLRVEVLGGGTVYGTLAVPSTGGWQTWTTIKHTVTLPAGANTLAIVAPAGGWNFNWFTITQGVKSATEENQNSTTEITVFPNPANDQITIAGLPVDRSSIAVIDLLGREHVSMISSETNMATINLSELASGLYIVKITSENGINQSIKFRKE